MYYLYSNNWVIDSSWGRISPPPNAVKTFENLVSVSAYVKEGDIMKAKATIKLIQLVPEFALKLLIGVSKEDLLFFVLHENRLLQVMKETRLSITALSNQIQRGDFNKVGYIAYKDSKIRYQVVLDNMNMAELLAKGKELNISGRVKFKANSAASGKNSSDFEEKLIQAVKDNYSVLVSNQYLTLKTYNVTPRDMREDRLGVVLWFGAF